jgi:ribose-phosphate pyrophosphokinase
MFGGSSNPELADSIANNLGVQLGKANIGKFPDGETNIEIKDSVRGKDVFII